MVALMVPKTVTRLLAIFANVPLQAIAVMETQGDTTVQFVQVVVAPAVLPAVLEVVPVQRIAPLKLPLIQMAVICLIPVVT